MDREFIYDLLWAGAGLIFILNGIESLLNNNVSGLWHYVHIFEIFIGTSLWTLRFIGLEEKRDWLPDIMDLPWYVYVLMNLVFVFGTVIVVGGF